MTVVPAWAGWSSVLFIFFLFGYRKAPLWLWSLFGFLLLWGIAAPSWILTAFVGLAAVFNVKPVRRTLFSGPFMRMFNSLGILPVISRTEKTAIEAGTVWVDGELFSGNPDFRRLLGESYPELTDREQAFLDGPVDELCEMVHDWEVFRRKEFDSETWSFLRENRFFGLIIPEKYGGHGFSHTAHSTIIAKLASRCGPLATTVMVPNSLGPAELLIHYGTDEQKRHYLPKLVTGEEMPCFALTEPGAGSDAGAMQSTGVVFRNDDGSLFLKLNWNKRYITLASISTVIGLAFKLQDPSNLLGKGVEPGITCALVPSNLEGVELGKRHDPLGVPFHNCPTRGRDVIVPAEAIIGGPDGAGNGWRMLMESLAVGRGISLPAQGLGSAKICARTIGAYAAIRKQFGINIGKFEGIEEAMARIGGYSYLMEAARKYTCGGLDKGAKPAVITAIAKYNFTELAREIINDAMDIVGGAGISRGPRNMFAHAYMAAPIGITVEGANILTRSLIIFGQGAIRCHPYVYREIDALTRGDVKDFDHFFWKHVGHAFTNGIRAFILSLARGRTASSPVRGPVARYYRRLAWSSASFAFMADIALVSYGGGLKMREKISGRYADLLGWMYLAAATLKRYEAEDRQEEDHDYFKWAMDHAFFRIQRSFDDIYREIRVPGLSWLFRGPVALWSRINRIGKPPPDETGHKVAAAMQQPGSQRDRMSKDIYIPLSRRETVGKYEYALDLVTRSAPLYRKLRDAVKREELENGPVTDQAEAARSKGILSDSEVQLIMETEDSRSDAIQVDEYTLGEYKNELPDFPEKEGTDGNRVGFS
ncbi:MAG: acyl-CoA dehydrogenase [Balneolaceae bacterium]